MNNENHLVELATRTYVAYNTMLTASVIFPLDIPVPDGFRDKLHRVVDLLEELETLTASLAGMKEEN
jgi:hypothetical protein